MAKKKGDPKLAEVEERKALLHKWDNTPSPNPRYKGVSRQPKRPVC